MENLVNIIANKVMGRTVVLPVFGDAESMATIFLAAKAVSPEKVFAICIDHGMLRKNEVTKISSFLKNLGVAFTVAKAEYSFLISTTKNSAGKIIGPLSVTYNPSDKRDLIIATLNKNYYSVVDDTFLNNNDVFVAGIHGIGGEQLVELRDKAVSIAREAGADEMFLRQPFPQSALAIRMLCNDSVIALTTEQRIKLDDLVSECSVAFSTRLVPLRTVGICDGVRTYKSMALLSNSGVESDFSMASYIACEIDKTLPYINRVVCRIDSSEHSCVYHFRPMHICKEGINVLREADAIVAEEFHKTGAAQFFAVLIPLVADTQKRFSIVVRAVSTSDYKTATALVPGKDFSLEVLENTVARIKETLSDTVDMVLYDITSKPPAAIEFE